MKATDLVGVAAKEAVVLHPEQPENMTGGRLRDYQVQGYKWLVGLYENGLNGILADEMGLGKTIQTIALLSHLRKHKVQGPFLLVVPLSTLANWVKEIKKWAPDMPVLQYHGSKELRHELRKHCLFQNKTYKGFRHLEHKKWKAKQIEKGLLPACLNETFDKNDLPITVTTYEIACKDRADLQSLRWKYIIVDEGHRLKNYKCRLFRELNLLSRGAVMHGGANKLLLTGTPLQNNLTELWSLLNFLMPEIFDDLEFFQRVFQFDEAVTTDKGEQLIIETHRRENIVSKLHKILAPFMMRRLKRDVEKNLPKKREIVLYVEMAPNQRGMYQSIVTGELKKLFKESKKLGKKSLNNMVMQLRKCSNHPFLQFEATNNNGEHVTDETIVTEAGKMRMLDYMLRYFKKHGHKVLIFSQFTSMLDIIEDYLSILRPDYKYCRIDGSVGLESRRQQMDDFNACLTKSDSGEPNGEDYLCFLLSTRAGGVGINLVAADTVILFDSDWNPHQDNQAQDRVHRIGQTKNVAVYRLISGKSVELRILQKANSKRKLERVVCARQARVNHKPSSEKNPSSPTHAHQKLVNGNTKALDIDELRELLEDDFTGHKDETGTIKDFDKQLLPLLDRHAMFTKDALKKGEGFEVVKFRADAIVGSVH